MFKTFVSLLSGHASYVARCTVLKMQSTLLVSCNKYCLLCFI